MAYPGAYPLRDRVLLLGILAVAAGLAFYAIGRQSLWLDEAFSVMLARLDWASLWRVIVSDQPNMALYHLLLHGWVRFGTSELAVRSLSALLVVATIVPLYALAARLFGPATAKVAAVLFAANAFIVAQGAQEARGYALAILLATTASLLFVRVLERPSFGRWAAYAMTGALLVYTHLFGALVLAAHFGWGMLWSGPPRHRRGILVTDAVIALLISPLFHPILTSTHLSWVRPPSWTSVAQAFADLAGRGGPSLLVAYFLACCVAVFWPQHGLSAEAKRFWRRGLLFAMSWFVVPVLGSLLVSLAWRPIFVSRYLIIAVPALVLIAAAGVTSLRPAPVRAVALAALLAVAAGGLVRWYGGRYPKENWRAAVHDVLANARPGDGIAFEPAYVRIPFEYYLERSGPEPATPHPVFPAAAWGALDPNGADLAERMDVWLRRNRPAQSRLWVVVSHEAAGKAEAGPVWLPAELERSSCRIGQQAYTHIRVLLYEAAPCDGQPHSASSLSSIGRAQWRTDTRSSRSSQCTCLPELDIDGTGKQRGKPRQP